VGNVTIDLVDGKRALGGAVSYAAAVASAFGERACVVTAHAPDADLGALFQASGAWPGQDEESAGCLSGVLKWQTRALVPKGLLPVNCSLTARLACLPLQGHHLVVVPSTQTLVFEHTYTFWVSGGRGAEPSGLTGLTMIAHCSALRAPS
jgi:hypothetical protein